MTDATSTQTTARGDPRRRVRRPVRGQGPGRAPVRVTVVDRRNHHLFQPLLYQVATAGAQPERHRLADPPILRGSKNTEVLLAEASGVDVERAAGALHRRTSAAYDYLIVATGAHALLLRPR